MSRLQRTVRLPGAVLLGLGSIVGTGVFVSLGLGAERAGAGVVVALGLAGLLAGLNGLSSAQLAAAHPISGGTYEYANRTIGPLTGFTAGWMFLSAKSASAATAALGVAGYLGTLLQLTPATQQGVALGAVVAITALVLGGLRRSNLVNGVLVSITLGSLVALVGASVPVVVEQGPDHFSPPLDADRGASGLLGATALLFVAYTGYGRIATLGEEVIEPRRTIPRAIWITVAVVCALYVAVASAAIGVLGAPAFAALTHEGGPLRALAEQVAGPGAAWWIGVAAVTAMLGVLLNLVLGLSRVALAMGRRADLPPIFGTIDAAGTTPVPAVLLVGTVIGGLTMLGDVGTTWSLSAFTVLVYYAVTNAAALRLPVEHRLYPRWVSVAGLLGCLGLAAWVDARFWIWGFGLLAVGHVGRWIGARVWAPREASS